MTFKNIENPPIPGCVWSVDTCQFIQFGFLPIYYIVNFFKNII